MPPRKTNYSRKNRTTSKTTRNTRQNVTRYTCNSPKFRGPKQECQWRIGSYRNVYSQFSGGTKTTLSPTMANRWIKYVNNGNRVYKVTGAEFDKSFGAQWSNMTPTSARRWLKKKFGTSVKDVTKGKGNTWLIASTKNLTGRPFNKQNW